MAGGARQRGVRERAVAVGAASAALLTLIVCASAARSDPVWATVTAQLDPVVEEQSPGGMFCATGCVTNTTGCVWDGDDSYWVQFNGRLARDETTAGHLCLIASDNEHYFELTVDARTPELNVWLGYAPQARTFDAKLTDLGHGDYRYRVCVIGPDYDAGSPRLQPVGDTGGVGVPTTITASIANLGPPRSIVADLRTSLNVGQCGTELSSDGIDPRWAWAT